MFTNSQNTCLSSRQSRENTKEKEISIWNGPPPLISHPTSMDYSNTNRRIVQTNARTSRTQQVVVVVAMDTNIALQGIALRQSLLQQQLYSAGKYCYCSSFTCSHTYSHWEFKLGEVCSNV